MANVRQNIDSAKPVLTLEQKIAIKKQQKFAQYCLNAYVKDKNSKAAKEKQRLERAAAKEKKLTKSAVAEKIQPEKAGAKTEKTWNVPVEILRAFFEANRMAALPLYLHVTRLKQFSGMLLKRDVSDLAKRLKRNPNSIMRQLSQLEELGMCKRFKDVWMFTGAGMFTALCGKTRVKLVSVKQLDRSYLSTLAYCTFISEQGKRLISKGKRKNVSISQGDVKLEISSSYTGNWIGRSIQTVSARRKAGKDFGMVDYQRQVKIKQEGGKTVKDSFCNARSMGETGKSEFLTTKGNTHFWLTELPSIFSSFLYFTTYSIYSNPKLRNIARQRQVRK